VLGVSVDTVYCHANWGASLGGVSFPLLADFHPKGKLAQDCGMYLEKAGIGDRATVLIDAGGIVRHASSVGPGGKRDMNELLSLCRDMDSAWEGAALEGAGESSGLAGGATLYVKDACGPSRQASLARTNLHLDGLTLRNVSQDSAALADLTSAAGKDQSPCLVEDGKALHEAGDIVRRLVEASGGFWADAG
jgi:hypothetical protein